MVIATQNPIEHEGTYPLPESQLDRFMMRLSIGYPSRTSELEILDTHGTRSPLEDLNSVTDAEEVVTLIKMAHAVHVAPTLKHYIVELSESTRDHPDIYLGASPRASLYLLKARSCPGREPGSRLRRPRRHQGPGGPRARPPHLAVARGPDAGGESPRTCSSRCSVEFRSRRANRPRGH